MKRKRILLVEDDPKAVRLIKSQLTARGYGVRVAGTGDEALAALLEHDADLVLLDLKLPDMDGIEVCTRLRKWSEVPVILVTATDDTEAKISALESGADDYVTKPIHLAELAARIEAVLRRSPLPNVEPPASVRIGDVEVDMVRREVSRGGSPIHLTRTEFEVLRELIKHSNRVLKYDHLLREVWGPGYDDVRSIHVHVCNLRRKVEGPHGHTRLILSVPGVGYQLRIPNGAN